MMTIESLSIYNRIAELTRSMFPPDTAFLLGVSGGPDSMAVLHIFNTLRLKYPFRVEVCTIDHGIRSESRDEVIGVSKKCREFSLPCHIFHAGLCPDASEEQARQYRHSIFSTLMVEEKLDYLVTGHHREDQAETILMRIVRGTGPAGLKAMSVLDGKIFRPLLEFRRKDILDFLVANRILWFEDETNNSSIYFRNRVRNEILPMLELENPQIVQSLVNLSSSIAEEHDALIYFCRSLSPQFLKLKNGTAFKIDLLPPVPGAFMVTVRMLWEGLKTSGELGRDHLLSLYDDFRNNKPFSRSNLPGSLVITRLNEFIYIGKPFEIIETEYEIKPEIPVKTIRGTFRVVPHPEGRIVIPSFPVTVRTRRKGDRINRMHMGMVKLKSIHSKYPSPVRNQLFVMTDSDGNIIWAEGAGKSYGITGNNYELLWESDDLTPDRFLK